MKFYLALGLIAIGVVKINGAESTAQCGVPQFPPNIGNRPHQRIVGGTVARPNSYPWIGSVKNTGEGNKLSHFCGATLIRVSDIVDASDILITAAHCMSGKPTHVLLGGHSLSNPRPGQQLVPIAKTEEHPKWNSQTVANDIAIVKLQTAVSFSETIRPACLPASGEQINEGASGIVAGWGLLTEEGAYPDLLQQALLPVSNMQKCKSAYKDMTINETIQYCAGYPEGKIDSCSEDSGGPYILKNSNGRYVLQGVVSFGEGCARANVPGVYARVSAYIPWINNRVKALTSVARS